MAGKSLKENFLFNLSYQILTVITPVVTVPYVSRALGPEGIGINSYISANVFYFIMFGVLGLGTYGQLEIAKVKNEEQSRSRLFFGIFVARVFLHFISLCCYFIYITFFISDYKTLYSIFFINIISSAIDCSWFFQGIEDFKNLAIKNSVIKILTVIAIFLLVKNSNDLSKYILINSISNCVSVLYFIPYLFRYVKITKVNFREILLHIKGGGGFFIPTIASTVVSVLDKTMLGVIGKSNIENGYYAETYKIVEMIFLLFSSLNMVMRSRMSFLVKNENNEEIKRLLANSLKFVMFLSFPISIGLAVTSSLFVPTFFGITFEPAIVLFEVMSIWLLFKPLSNCLLEQYVIPVKGIKIATRIIWIGAISDFCLNLVFIYYLNALGAVIASLITELIILIGTLIYSRGVFNIKELLFQTWKIVISTIVMAIILLLIKKFFTIGIGNMFLFIIIGMFLYFSQLIIMKDEFLYKNIIKIFKR